MNLEAEDAYCVMHENGRTLAAIKGKVVLFDDRRAAFTLAYKQVGIPVPFGMAKRLLKAMAEEEVAEEPREEE